MLEVVAAGHGARVDGVDDAVGVWEVGLVEPDLLASFVLVVGVLVGVLVLGVGLGGVGHGGVDGGCFAGVVRGVLLVVVDEVAVLEVAGEGFQVGWWVYWHFLFFFPASF